MNAILFDLDGTLIDSTEGIVQSFNYAFDAHDFPRPKEEEICSLIGYPLEVMLEELGVNKAQVDMYAKTYKEKYSKISTQTTKLLPHAKEAIKLAHSLAPLGVVTTKTGLYSKEILEHFGVAKYFKTIVGRENVDNLKPHAEPILKALENLNVKPDKNSFMIGDTCLDMKAAKNANISGIALLGGYGKEADLVRCSPKIASNCFEAIKLLC